MIHTGIAGWLPRQRLDGRWLPAPDHSWEGVGEIELDPSDDRALWAKRGPGILLNRFDGERADVFSRADLASCELAFEFILPVESASGIFLLGLYEIALADTADLADDELTPGACGGIQPRWQPETRTAYDGHPPLTNAALPAGEWQSLRLLFQAPRFDETGRKIANARFDRITLNDTLIHERVECAGPTRGALPELEVSRGPIRLRGDRGPVAFREMRMRSLGDD
jgi:hypothetical protein